jgi:hypothetical protein
MRLNNEEAAAVYEVDIVGRDDVMSLLSPTLYKVQVAGPAGVHVMWHRYQDFSDLDRCVRPRFPSLPYMPSKGMLCKIEDGFLDKRQEKLAKVLRAMVSVDPQVKNPKLRKFLGIDAFEKAVRTGMCADMISEMLPPSGQTGEIVIPSDFSSDDDAACSSAAPSSWPSPCRAQQRTWRAAVPPQLVRCMTNPRNSPKEPSSLCSSPRCPCNTSLRRSISQELGQRHEEQEAPSKSSEADDLKFRETAIVIARDVARVFAGDSHVDEIRLRIAEILRGYARTDPELGYVQGMCFAAAVTCLDGENSSTTAAQKEFNSVMCSLRELWQPGFPMVSAGIPALERLLVTRDPELHEHFSKLSLDLGMIIPGAWLSIFAKWLPRPVLMDILPFLVAEGVAGFLAVTYVVILHHRGNLLHCRTIDEALPYVHNLFSQKPPENLVGMCRMALPAMESQLDHCTLPL